MFPETCEIVAAATLSPTKVGEGDETNKIREFSKGSTSAPNLRVLKTSKRLSTRNIQYVGNSVSCYWAQAKKQPLEPLKNASEQEDNGVLWTSFALASMFARF